MVNFSLEGKVALVTGASYGIGFAIATGFAKAGAKIVFNDIKQELVDKGIEAYKAEGIDAKGYVCDVTDEDAVNAMVANKVAVGNFLSALAGNGYAVGNKIVSPSAVFTSAFMFHKVKSFSKN